MNLQGPCKSWYLAGEEIIDALAPDFLRSISIWFYKPHTVNRRLCGIDVLYQEKCLTSNGSWKESLDEIGNSYEGLLEKLKESENEGVDKNASIDIEDLKEQRLLQVRKLLPRQLERTAVAYEIALLDPMRCWALFTPLMKDKAKIVSTPPHTYVISFEENPSPRIQLWVEVLSEEKEGIKEKSSIQWLLEHLLPKLKKWCEIKNENDIISSLQLVPIDRYNKMYQELKKKYAPKFIEIWPEKTDPLKFVYEDVAIATYLILLWEQERKEKKINQNQSFVDLGCGNGLLVYILINEGHPGIGIDIRKRKIWDYYGTDVQDKLKIAPITPSSDFLFPEYDWLIGNHSDELTPWIPVMAARSSYNTNFFLLPCCTYDFNCKYQRSHSGMSQYQSYLEYIAEVSRICGFTVLQDKLRIPSTRRICFVGMNEAKNSQDMAKKEDDISKFLSERCSTTVSFPSSSLNSSNLSETSEGASNHHSLQNDCERPNDSNHWIPNFSTRCAIEPVRNCTKLNEELKETIVSQVASALLSTDPVYINVENDKGVQLWNSGGKLPLSELAGIVGKENLIKLKSEFGGLQTLLKNHYQIFQVTQSFVSLKNYSCSEVLQRKRKPRPATVFNKIKPCWFDKNHPNGCPVKSEECRYIHECNNV